MRIKKILNHNVVIAQNARGCECVLAGKGIGFGKKKGDYVEEMQIEKTFTTREKGTAEKLSLIIQDIPPHHLRVCDEIINTAKNELKDDLSESIYLTLIDHLSSAISRHQEGLNLTSSLKWEMKQLYPKEFAVGVTALAIIQKRLNICFPVDEAAYIAFHLVNAGSSRLSVLDNLGFVKDIFEIVKTHFLIEIDEDSLEYYHFLNHLKYFSYRVINSANEPIKTGGPNILARIQSELPNEAACIEKINRHINEKYKYTVSAHETEYLIIHLHSMLTQHSNYDFSAQRNAD